MDSVMLIFLIAALGYALGRVQVAGLQLGSAGVLLVALFFGHYGMEVPALVRDMGLALFVASIGMIAGPTFFRNFKNNALAYILLGLLIIACGAGVCVAAIELLDIPAGLAVGLMSGALTSTPGLAAAVEASGDAMASVGYGIAYPFGVVGVVLFVQLIPKLLGADMAAEAASMTATAGRQPSAPKSRPGQKKLLQLDEYGYFPFALAILAGVLIGKLVVPLPGGASFSLGTSGGPLLSGLILGHFGHIGPIAVNAPAATAKPIRELGLIMFLMGAGTNAGKGFIEILRSYGVILFFVGAVMTLIPMVIGYFAARRAFRLSLFNSLGSICGGMTSTPALGTLISLAKSEAVVASYAATYPVALIAVVLACQLIAVFV